MDEAAFVSRWPDATKRLAQLQSQVSFLHLSLKPKNEIRLVWNDEIALVGLGQNLNGLQSQPDAPLQINFYWQSLRHVSTPYSNFLHLVNAQRTSVAAFDYQPFDGYRPFSDWPLAQTIGETCTFVLPEDLPPGIYTLVARLYKPDTLERLPLANRQRRGWLGDS